MKITDDPLVTAPANGLFAILTNRIVEAWARAGSRDFDGAIASLDQLSTQKGVDGLRLMHKALILDFAGKDKETDEAYKAAIAVMGTGPRGTEAYGRFLIRHGRLEDARALYQRAIKENPGNPFAQCRNIREWTEAQQLEVSPHDFVRDGHDLAEHRRGLFRDADVIAQ